MYIHVYTWLVGVALESGRGEGREGRRRGAGGSAARRPRGRGRERAAVRLRRRQHGSEAAARLGVRRVRRGGGSAAWRAERRRQCRYGGRRGGSEVRSGSVCSLKKTRTVAEKRLPDQILRALRKDHVSYFNFPEGIFRFPIHFHIHRLFIT